MDYRDVTFPAGERILVDGNTFVGCTFEDGCIIEYRGVAPNAFTRCRFGVPTFEFLGPSGAVITFLKMFHDMPGGNNILDAIFRGPFRVVDDD